VIINDNNAAVVYLRENPSVSFFPTNGLAIAWQATDPVTNMISVQARVLEESTGVLVTNEFEMNLRCASLPTLSSIFSLTPEKLVATWTASGIDGSMLGISQRDFTCTISPSVTPTRTPSRSRSRGLTPIYSSPTRSSKPSLLPKVLCAAVPFSGVEETVNTTTLGDQTSPSTSGFDSQIVTVWESSHLGRTDLGDPYFTLQGRFGFGPEFQIHQFANGYQRYFVLSFLSVRREPLFLPYHLFFISGSLKWH
jgi:hypothetical protein